MNKSLLIAVAVVVVLGAIYLLTSPTTREVGADAVSWEPPYVESLDGVRIEFADRHVELRRAGEEWSLREPIEFPVARRAGQRLDRLFSADGEPVLVVDERDADAASLTRYGFDDDTETFRVTVFDAGSPADSFVVGARDESSRGSARTWVRAGDDERLYRLAADLREALALPLDDWRERDILSIGAEQRRRIRIVRTRSGEQELSFERGDDGEGGTSWTVEGAGDVGLDDELVARAMTRLYSLRADGFADGVSASDANVESPAFGVLFEFDDGSIDSVSFGDAVPSAGDDGERRYVQRRGERLYVVTEAAARNFNVRLGDLRPRELIHLERDDVVEIVIEGGEERIVLERNDIDDSTPEEADQEEWRMSEPRGGVLDENAVRQVLTNATRLSATRIAEGEIGAQEAGLATPRRTLTVRLRDGAEHRIHVGSAVAGDADADVYVRVDDGPFAQIRARSARHLMKSRSDLVESDDGEEE